MTITDFVELLVDDSQEIEIWDIKQGSVIWKGKASEIPYKFLYEEILSIDPIYSNTVTLNIERGM